MFEAMLVIYTIYTFAKIYISVSEANFVKKAKEQKPIILSKENFKIAGDYKIESSKISVVESLYDLLLFFGWVSFGFKVLDSVVNFENSTLEAIVYILSFISINYVLGLAFDLYKTFNLDKRYGFSTIDIKTYVIDQIKGAIIFFLFGSLFIWLLVWIIESFENWWIYGFVAVFAVILFINMIYPTLIAPIFNKFTILDDTELKEAIENLLQNAGLKSSGVFTIDASKRDKRLNAYFGGLGKAKRVVLYDTLVKKLTKNELLAVLGHELGHFKHKDIVKNIFASGLMMFIMFFIFGNLPESIFEGIGTQKSAYMVLILFLLLSPVLSFIMMPIFGLLSRHNEFKADEYGSEVGGKEELANALMKLVDENKSFPLSHPLTVTFYHTHPSVVERLQKLGVDV